MDNRYVANEPGNLAWFLMQLVAGAPRLPGPIQSGGKTRGVGRKSHRFLIDANTSPRKLQRYLDRSAAE